jgi:hypothetical protein
MRVVFLVTLTLVASAVAALDKYAPVKRETPYDISFGNLYGGNGGASFSDLNYWPNNSVVPHITIFTITGDKRIDSLAYNVNRTGGLVFLLHGDTGGKQGPSSLVLTGGEVINKVEIAVGKHHHKPLYSTSRIFWMRVTTSNARTLEGGVLSDPKKVVPLTPPAGFTRLVGFEGRSGDELDAVAAVWGR